MIMAAARGIIPGRQSVSGLIGYLYRADSERGNLFVAQITLPVVDFADDFTQPIYAFNDQPDGKYLIQLKLPDGQVIFESFDYDKDQSQKIFIDLPHKGPHEWLGLEALRGDFSEMEVDEELLPSKVSRSEYPEAEEEMSAGPDDDGGSSPPAPRPSPRPSPEPAESTHYYNELKDQPEQQGGYRLSLIKQEQQPGGSLFAGPVALDHLAWLIDQQFPADSIVPEFGAPELVDGVTTEDQQFAKFEFIHSGLQTAMGQGGSHYFGPGGDLERRYLLQESRHGKIITALPTPWVADYTADEVDISLLLDKTTLGESLDYTLTIGDPMISNALGYVNAGAIHNAVSLINFEEAREMLFNKVSRPMMATVGGYMLVLGLNHKAYRDNNDQWRDWVGNLDNWFDWLPDGAIIHAATHFMLGDDNKDEARVALMRAYDRGIPFFTFGLKLMLDGMRHFARDGYPPAKQKLQVLETIAGVTDPSKPLTSITVTDSLPL